MARGEATKKMGEVIKSFDDSRGMLFELRFCTWLNENKKDGKTEVRYNVKSNGEEIDCIAESDKIIDVYECKIKIGEKEVNNVIMQLKRKCAAVEQKYGKRAFGFVASFERLSPETKAKLESDGITVIDDCDKLIKDSRLRAFLRRDYLRALVG